jgi:trans-aconitate 2-methyltransferase
MADEVENFYDEFSEFQLNSGLHERHYLMHEKLIELGMNENSSLLEIGAGIGMITSLIRKTVTSGIFVTNDISPKSLKLNQKLNTQNNIEFVVGNVVELDFKTKFDFITLFDVLEHIPISQHDELFKKFYELLHPNGVLFINIPSPECLEYHIKHEKEVLQLIDQPIHADILLNVAYQNKFLLFFFKTYSLWHKRDYQMIIFRKQYEWKKIQTSIDIPVSKKIRNKLSNIKQRVVGKNNEENRTD